GRAADRRGNHRGRRNRNRHRSRHRFPRRSLLERFHATAGPPEIINSEFLFFLNRKTPPPSEAGFFISSKKHTFCQRRNGNIHNRPQPPKGPVATEPSYRSSIGMYLRAVGAW